MPLWGYRLALHAIDGVYWWDLFSEEEAEEALD